MRFSTSRAAQGLRIATRLDGSRPRRRSSSTMARKGGLSSELGMTAIPVGRKTAYSNPTGRRKGKTSFAFARERQAPVDARSRSALSGRLGCP
jgi:hypothetical protein